MDLYFVAKMSSKLSTLPKLASSGLKMQTRISNTAIHKSGFSFSYVGYDVKVLDSILITARPVDAYYCDPSQIRWLWKTAHKSTVLQYA